MISNSVAVTERYVIDAIHKFREEAFKIVVLYYAVSE